ncbi:MAG TPA: undecaprenyl-diphosphate phosphatase [Patescibacteria group bacterium]|nr:undecaprenyl-diphosphate phosphatase [Patescibacteria group bacterium]
MNIFHAIVLGIVEGLTEFLPVSSTFHLIWVAKLLGLPQTDFQKLFEVFIQGGAILSIFVLYWQVVTKDFQLVKKVAVAFVPTAIVGLVLYKVIKDVFFAQTILMLVVFISIGLLFFVTEFLIKKEHLKLTKELTSLTYMQAAFIGLLQALAVMPGVSRAGAVIVAMMFLKYKRSEAAKFSFLLAVPTILAASGYDLLKMRGQLSGSGNHTQLLAIGTTAAFISAYFVVKWFVKFLQNNSLNSFGWYRIVVGLLLFFVK